MAATVAGPTASDADDSHDGRCTGLRQSLGSPAGGAEVDQLSVEATPRRSYAAVFFWRWGLTRLSLPGIPATMQVAAEAAADLTGQAALGRLTSSTKSSPNNR